MSVLGGPEESTSKHYKDFPSVDTAWIEENRRKTSLEYAKSFFQVGDTVQVVLKKAEEIYKYLYSK